MSTNPNRTKFQQPSPSAPPTYQIDLSLPPRDRYKELCTAYRADLGMLLQKFNSMKNQDRHGRIIRAADFILKNIFMRRARTKEETEEMRGIAEASGIPLHLVVAGNALLDQFVGSCTSGGVKVHDANGKAAEGIVHFRGMDSYFLSYIKDLLVCLEYVRDGKVVGRGITYVGFIGVLTGVRQGLSMSFNSRNFLNSSSPRRDWAKQSIHLRPGFRRSTPSILRDLLLSPGSAPSLTEIKTYFEKKTTGPCYLTFCSPKEVLVLEKDFRETKHQISDEILVVTSHDLQMELWKSDQWAKFSSSEKASVAPQRMEAMLRDSIVRKSIVMDKWMRTRSENGGVGVNDVCTWLGAQSVRNSQTHFACVMDPAVDGGGLIWVGNVQAPWKVQARDPAVASYVAQPPPEASISGY